MSSTPEKPDRAESPDQAQGGAEDDVSVAAIRGQQHTWNHEERPQNEKEGNEAFGGTRKGAENVEGSDDAGRKDG